MTRDAVTGAILPSVAVGLGNNYARATGTAAFPADDKWHHLAFSADGAQLRLYLDSTNIASVDYVGNINAAQTPWISIGSRVATQTDTNAIPPLYILDPTNPDLLSGSVDELALWDRELSAAEIKGIYQAGKTNAPLTSVVETPPVVTTPATLTTSLAAGNLTISWSPTGGHLESTAVLGTGANWTSLSTTNPTVVPISGTQQYFRVVNP
ncbi:MAG: LamG-like jellyroll fold domain-containing protein [Limisphaerales bacterium]